MDLIKRKKDGVRIASRNERRWKYNASLLLMALPGLVCLLLFSYLPMFGLIIAFKDFAPLKGVLESEWVGLDNFLFFFTSQDAVRTIRNTLLYSVAFLILDLILGVAIAILLYNLKHAVSVKVYHTIILIPKFLSIVIISFVVYGILSPSYGALNAVLHALGGNGKTQWYSIPEYWPLILTIVHCWMTIGGGCMYYYAALSGIDPTLFEAAELDGANSWQRARHIMIPELVPIMVMLTILGIGGLFSGNMGLFYQVPKNMGVLYETTDIINTYTYRALLGGSFERSAAVGFFQSAIGLFLVGATNAIVKKISPENAIF